MKRLHYSEKLVEETIKFFPKELLGRDLTLLMQQPLFDGYRPDLIFKDKNQTIYIVEVQIGQLDKKHIYRCLEYRDLYLANSKSDKEIKLISFANSIPEKYSIILKTHSIEGIAIEKRDLIKTIEKLRPNLKIAKSKKELEKENNLSSFDILTAISKSKLTNRSNLNITGLLFYQFPYKRRYDDFIGHLTFNLKSLKKYPQRYFKDYKSQDDVKIEVPVEIIVSENIKTLTWEDFRMLESWFLNLNKYSIFDKYSNHEVILGHRYYSDYIDYEDYIKDRIKLFNHFGEPTE